MPGSSITGPRYLSDRTRQMRYAKLREFLDTHGLDAVYVFGDGAVAYIAGEFMRYPDAFVLFTRHEDPVLFVSDRARAYVLYGLEKNRRDFWIQDYRINDPSELKAVFTARHLEHARIGITGRNISWHAYQTLKQIVPNAELTDITQDYQILRRVKLPEDIQLIRRSVQVVDTAVSALAQQVHASMFEHEIKAIMESSMYQSGAHDTLNLCNADARDISFVSMPGDHCSAQTRPGDLVCCEVTACFHQMWTQQIIHISLGPPSDTFQALHNACKAGHDAAAGIIRPGANARDIVNTGCARIEALGFLSGRQFLSGPPGHLVGFERDEGTFSYSQDLILEESMVLDLHLSAAVPDWTPGKSGVFGPGSTFLVTADGCESLNKWQNDVLFC